MKKQIDDVQKFHEKFGHPVSTELCNIETQRALDRVKWIKSECSEYIDAVIANDKVEIADALGDILYFVLGTVVEHGLQDNMEDVFQAIQDSNMSKLGADGNPMYRADGKIMKGPYYFTPTAKIKELLTQ